MRAHDSEPMSGPTLAFAILASFFLGVLILELVSGEALGVPAKRAERPRRYWTVLAFQAGLSILLAAFIYFFTH